MRNFIFILFLFSAFSQVALACSCGTVPFDEAVESSDEIFIGRIIEMEYHRDLLPSKTHESLPMFRKQYWVVTLEVSKKWKGSKKNKIRVRQTSNSCEFEFEFGKEYIVFAEFDGSLGWNGTRNYTTWLCSRTIDMWYLTEYGKEDWTWDDRDRLDEQFPNPVQTASFFNNWPIWLLLFFTTIGFGAFYIRKRNAL